jgi:hypothetical protein
MIDTKKLSEELSKMPRGGIVFIETSASRLLDVHLAAVKWISEKDYTQIIVSASIPCKKLLQLYEENKIDIRRLIILCAYPNEKEEDKQKNINIIHTPSNCSLADIAILLSKRLKRTEEKKFIFIDSINTILIPNKPDTLAIFIHLILTKMRTNNVSGLLISLETETNNEARAEIAQLCDKFIKI